MELIIIISLKNFIRKLELILNCNRTNLIYDADL